MMKRQLAIQTAIQSRIADFACADVQQIVQRGRRVPVLLHGHFATGSAQPVDRQYRCHPQPSYISSISVKMLRKELFQT
jgi:hypothetical protein